VKHVSDLQARATLASPSFYPILLRPRFRTSGPCGLSLVSLFPSFSLSLFDRSLDKQLEAAAKQPVLSIAFSASSASRAPRRQLLLELLELHVFNRQLPFAHSITLAVRAASSRMRGCSGAPPHVGAVPTMRQVPV